MSLPFDDELEQEQDSGCQNCPIVTFKIKDSVYGVSTAQVQGMLEMPEIRPVPHAPSCVRGLINLRGEVLPVVDLRVRLGLPSKRNEAREFSQMMKAREEDHLKWLAELEASVQEDRPFTLATDPHQCAFGRWYDSFRTGDHVAMAMVQRFDAPHRKIHAVAAQVAERVAAGDHKGARQIIERTRDRELAKMKTLFESLVQHYGEGSREQAIILEALGFTYAVAVDSIESVEYLDDQSEQESPQSMGNADVMAVVGLGRRAGSQQVIQLLTAGSITEGVDILELV